MPNFRSLSGAARVAALSLVFALPAQAEDLGVILSNLNYRVQADLASGPATDRIERALREAGFSTVLLQNQRRDDATDRLARLVPRMEAAQRLVIVINGHVVASARDSWLLTPNAGVPDAFSLGGESLPLGPLFDIAARKQGAAVVAIASQRGAAKVGPGLTPGYAARPAPQGVTVLTGSALALSELMRDGLLVPGRAMAQALRDHPGVAANGFVPVAAAFFAAEPGTPTIVDAPKSREAVLAETEAALGLRRADRRRVQQSLAILGFDPRGIDGVFGPGSRRAIAGWQRARGHDGTGFLNRNQTDALVGEGDARAAELEADARARQSEDDARDTAYWRDTGQGGDEPGLRAYLERYPDGLYSHIAEARLRGIEAERRAAVSQAERRDWDEVVEEDTARGYRAYLAAWPDGAFVDEAEARLADREEAEANAEEIAGFAATERRVAGSTTTRRLVENRLTALGLDPGPIDGEFDDATRRALRRFQQTRGLPVTGYVNQGTMVRLLLGG